MTTEQHRQLVALTADVAWLMGYLEALMNATKSESQHTVAAEISTSTLAALLELVESTKPTGPQS